LSHAMAEVVSCRPVTTDAQFCAWVSPCGICCGQSGTGTCFFLSFSVFHLSVSLHRGFLYSYIIWGMNIRPVSGCSSET
jgi:hypothetical protein